MTGDRNGDLGNQRNEAQPAQDRGQDRRAAVIRAAHQAQLGAWHRRVMHWTDGVVAVRARAFEKLLC